MKNAFLKQSLLAMAVIGLAALPQPALSQEGENKLDALTCRDVMIMSGADRDTTIAFVHGYLVHKLGHMQVDLEKLTTSTEQFLNACIAEPAAKAIAMMEKQVARENELEALSCKDVMILSGDDRDTTVAFIHGYLISSQSASEVNLDAMTDGTEKFLNDCVDNPDAKAIATMQAALPK